MANIRIPNHADRTVTPTLTLGWSADGSSPGNCQWQIAYLWRSDDENTAAAAQETLTVTTAASATANGMRQSTVTLQVPSATDLCLHVQVKRLAAGVTDTIADTVEMHGMCLQFTSDKLGTAT